MSARWETGPMPRIERVEMWCDRHYVESREAALEALAAGETIKYRAFRKDTLEWAVALHLVHRLLGESSNAKTSQFPLFES
jgi:hypothetical protein